ncbi:MAG: hypothetical protein IT530_15585 [Burkholderiales bacterium]|nr:hypothetical protein [Burkholderiales bacterium]
MMIDDLRSLNHLIVRHWLGELGSDEAAYLDFSSVCIGQLAHSAEELKQLSCRLKEERWTAFSVGELNRRYLSLVRLASMDDSGARVDGLVRLGITLRQAAFFRTLSDHDLERLAYGCSGPMIRFSLQTFRRGVRLHAQAGKHHATALVAARQTLAPKR